MRQNNEKNGGRHHFRLPLHILKVSSGLIIGSRSNLDTAITWSRAGCVAISFNCVPSKPDPIPTLSMRTPRSRITRDGSTISSIDEVVARTRSSWGILLRPLFLNQLVFTPVKLDPAEAIGIHRWKFEKEIHTALIFCMSWKFHLWVIWMFKFRTTMTEHAFSYFKTV